MNLPQIKKSMKVEYHGQPSELSTFITGAEHKPDSTSDSGNNATKWIMGTALATTALMYSTPSRAGIEGILNSLVAKCEEMMKPMLEGTFGGFGSLINGGSADASSAVVQAIGTSTDGIIEATKEIANNKIGLASMPPPNYCESDEIGKASKVLSQSATQTMDELVATSASLHNTTDNRLYATKISNIASRYNKESGQQNRHIQMASIINKSKISSEEEVKAFIDGVDSMSVEATSKIRLSEASTVSNSGRRKAFYVAESGKAARLELAKGVLFQTLSERMVAESGESKTSLLEKEVERTYGGEGSWRSELLNYADPTPLLAELNKQQALTNYLLLESLKKTTTQNTLIASQALKHK